VTAWKWGKDFLTMVLLGIDAPSANLQYYTTAPGSEVPPGDKIKRSFQLPDNRGMMAACRTVHTCFIPKSRGVPMTLSLLLSLSPFTSLREDCQ